MIIINTPTDIFNFIAYDILYAIIATFIVVLFIGIFKRLLHW
jgi:hypothetical protein